MKSAPLLMRCPLSGNIMEDPVILCESGITYDRPSIQKWIQEGNLTCPTSGNPLAIGDGKTHHLIPNVSVKSLIQKWKRDHDDDEGEDSSIKRKITSTKVVEGESIVKCLNDMEMWAKGRMAQSFLLSSLQKLSKQVNKDSWISSIVASGRGVEIMQRVLTAYSKLPHDTHSHHHHDILHHAIAILSCLPMTKHGMKILSRQLHIQTIIIPLLNNGSLEAKTNTLKLLHKLMPHYCHVEGIAAIFPPLLKFLTTCNNDPSHANAKEVLDMLLAMATHSCSTRTMMIDAGAIDILLCFLDQNVESHQISIKEFLKKRGKTTTKSKISVTVERTTTTIDLALELLSNLVINPADDKSYRELIIKQIQDSGVMVTCLGKFV